jgi:4-hydroxymandelate oxidase
MSPLFDQNPSRRRFLQFLAASPLLAEVSAPALAQNMSAPSRLPDPMAWAPRDLDNLISDPAEALDVFDFEPVARKNLPPAHFGYLVTGIDDEVTLRANREGFLKFQLRPRRLVELGTIDMTTELFGETYDSPIVIAPTGSNRAFHPDGEAAVAKAARTGNHLQILSSGATTSIEEAIAAREAPVWFQLYARGWQVTEALLRRAERAGSPVVVVTIDGGAPTNWETLLRLRRTDTRQCGGCHGGRNHDYVARRPNLNGIDVSDPTSLDISNLTWDSIKRLRDMVKMKIVLKGILTHEDAILAADIGYRRHHGFEPWRTGRGLRLRDDRDPAGDHHCGRWSHDCPRGQRLPTRHRHHQGSGHGRAGRVCRAALSLGPRRLRSAGC